MFGFDYRLERMDELAVNVCGCMNTGIVLAAICVWKKRLLGDMESWVCTSGLIFLMHWAYQWRWLLVLEVCVWSRQERLQFTERKCRCLHLARIPKNGQLDFDGTVRPGVRFQTSLLRVTVPERK